MSAECRLVRLHHHYEQYRDLAIALLNDEWPQSTTIRLRRLERSCDELPTSYLLIADDDNQLIGYCYLDRLFDDEQSVIVESVCIQRALRGKGLSSDMT
jgi:L-amino acid N-acyltransferase YncA